MKNSVVRRTLVPVAILGLVALGASACSSGSTPASTSSSSVKTGATFDKALFAQLPADIQKSKVIKAGVSTTGAPFASVDATGAVVGVVPDLAEQLGTILGVKIEWVQTPFPGLIPALQAGKSDIIWSALIDTKEREALIDFVPYVAATDTLLVAKGNPKKISDLDSLCGLTAGSATGSTEALALVAQAATCKTEGKGELTVKQFDTQGDVQTALRSGKLDADFGTTISMRLVAKQLATALEVLPTTYPSADFGVAFPKGSDALTTVFIAGIKKLIDSGAYKTVLTKYDAATEALTPDAIVLNAATSK